jgi:ABC-2 type transport system permease protein
MATAAPRAGALAVARRELERFRATPRLWILAVFAPAALAALLMATFVERSPPGLPILAVDLDQSAFSRALLRQLESAPALKIAGRAPDVHAAAAALRRGEGYAIVVLPRHLERDALAGRATSVQLFYNRQMLTAGNLVQREVRKVTATVGAGLGLARGVLPAVTAEIHPAFNPGLDYARFLALPLVLAVLHIAVVVVGADVTGRELRDGTAGDWLEHAGGRAVPALLGKLLPYALWFILFGIVLLTVLNRLLGLEPAGSLLLRVTGWSLLVTACLGVGSALVALTGNLRMALSVASVVVSPAFAYAGLTFPALAMPGVAAAWSLLLPLTHGLAVHTQQLAMDSPAAATAPHLVALAGLALLPLLFTRRWRRLLADRAAWGAE